MVNQQNAETELRFQESMELKMNTDKIKVIHKQTIVCTLS
jgi:hypothetical protein